MVRPSLSSEGKQYTLDCYLIANKIHAPMIINIKYIHVELFSPLLPTLQREPIQINLIKLFDKGDPDSNHVTCKSSQDLAL